MNLWELPARQSGHICELKNTLPESFRHRLQDLGFMPGRRVTSVLAPSLGAPRLYQLDSAVYSLEQDVAMAIEVEPVTES